MHGRNQIITIKSPLKRVQNNTNLSLHTSSDYKGLSVNGDNEHPLVANYLDRTLTTIQKSLDEYPRTFALRFDLRYPSNLQDKSIEDGKVIKVFISSLKAKIKADRKRSAKQGRSHDTKVRYVWCKEVSRGNHCHFHFLLLLNHAAYNQRGKLDSVNMNTARRIETAWQAALNKHSSEPCDISGLVEFPDNGAYTVPKNDKQALADLFYRVSYLCKSRTKPHGNNKHVFECSRV